MGINKTQLRELIIRPTLQYLDLWSEAAENLLMGTAAQESQLGTYIHQLGKGPALGIYQMEPATHVDILQNFLPYKEDLRHAVESLQMSCHAPNSYILDDKEMIGNLYYATAMARIHYIRIPAALPEADNLQGLAAYWKQHYNTVLGAGIVEEFIDNYNKYVA